MWPAIKERMKDAGADLAHDPTQVRIHDFRHYFVTVFYAGSGNLLATKDAARHVSSETTSRYAHVANDLVDQTYDQVINRREDEAGAAHKVM